jgi:hypothetical protein
METEPQNKSPEFETTSDFEQASGGEEMADTLDPNDSNLLRDQVKGQTTEHARPPRLEDEGQSGG